MMNTCNTIIKRSVWCFCLAMLSVSVAAQTPLNATYQQYIRTYSGIAVREMINYGIPASITLAQAIFESSAGQSELARKGNNHFGIKCHGWTGRSVYHDDDARQECFRAYDNVLESFEDHSRFLRDSPRYRSLFSLSPTDYVGWARGLKACGYATNPQYADRLIRLIESYQLHQYDLATNYDSPAPVSTPAVSGVAQPQSVGSHRLYLYNQNVYLIARQGDTFKVLAAETGISYKKLARYNELDRDVVLQQGSIVYLHKKRSKADKAFKNKPHIVRSGESMYSIAQSYGIRLKSLYSKNNLPADFAPHVGDRLRVY